MQIIHERVKKLYISQRDIFDLIITDKEDIDFDCTTKRFIKLPEDIKVLSVHYVPERRAFMYILESIEFEPVDPMEEIPELSVNDYRFKILHLEKDW